MIDIKIKKNEEGCCTDYKDNTRAGDDTDSTFDPVGEVTIYARQPWDTRPQISQAAVNPRHLVGHLRHPVHDHFHYLLDLCLVTRQLVFRNGEGDVSPLAVAKQGLHAAESDLVFDGSRQVVDLGEAQDDVVPEVFGQQFPVALVQLGVIGGEALVEANNEEEGDGSRRHDQLLPLPEPPLRAGVILIQVKHVRCVDHLVRKTMRQSCGQTGRDSSKDSV